jgi:hypothetical protein
VLVDKDAARRRSFQLLRDQPPGSGMDSGNLPIPPAQSRRESVGVATFVLMHSHRPKECAIAVAAWKGFESPLRGGRPLGSCANGGHRVWWTVEAPTRDAALSLLPHYVAQRTVADEVREVPLP